MLCHCFDISKENVLLQVFFFFFKPANSTQEFTALALSSSPKGFFPFPHVCPHSFFFLTPSSFPVDETEHGFSLSARLLPLFDWCSFSPPSLMCGGLGSER